MSCKSRNVKIPCTPAILPGGRSPRRRSNEQIEEVAHEIARRQDQGAVLDQGRELGVAGHPLAAAADRRVTVQSAGETARARPAQQASEQRSDEFCADVLVHAPRFPPADDPTGAMRPRATAQRAVDWLIKF